MALLAIPFRRRSLPGPWSQSADRRSTMKGNIIVSTAIAPNDAVVVAYRRTPIGRARKGSLAGERPEDLALAAIRGALAAVPQLDSAEFADAYVGCAVPQGAQGDNIAVSYTHLTLPTILLV